MDKCLVMPIGPLSFFLFKSVQITSECKGCTEHSEALCKAWGTLLAAISQLRTARSPAAYPQPLLWICRAVLLKAKLLLIIYCS